MVKNVAGYDFCKLLTGSLGTLAVVTQLAFKVKPLAESAVAVVGECPDLATVEKALNLIAMLETPPVAIDVLIGEGPAKLKLMQGGKLVGGTVRGDACSVEITIRRPLDSPG